MQKLRGCRTCGGKTQIDENRGITFVLCDGCGEVTSFREHEGREETIRLYNTRATDVTIAKLQVKYDELKNFEKSECAKLLEQVARLKARLEQAEKERDVAVKDLHVCVGDVCLTCRRYWIGGRYDPDNCEDCEYGTKYEWRGADKQEAEQ